jgi:hypothetical protein
MASPPPKRLISSDDIPNAPEWLGMVLDPLNAFIKATASALDKGATFSQQFAGEVKTVTLTPPDDWVPLTLLGGVARWSASHELPAARRDLDGMVHVKGLARNKSSASAPFVEIAALPDGMAPRLNIDGLPASASGTFFQLGVASGGKIVVTGGSIAAGAYIGLGMPAFPAADRTPPRWERPLDVRLGTKDAPFPGRPGKVLVLSCHQVQSPTAPAPVTWLDWTAAVVEKTVPVLRIHRVWGLMPGIPYALTLAILPE